MTKRACRYLRLLSFYKHEDSISRLQPRSHHKKKAQPCELGNLYKTEFMFLAPRAGLEPATCGLTEKSVV